jgi:hypothetical protein
MEQLNSWLPTSNNSFSYVHSSLFNKLATQHVASFLMFTSLTAYHRGLLILVHVMKISCEVHHRTYNDDQSCTPY